MKLFNTIDTSFDKFDETVKRYLSKAFNSLGIEYTNTQIFGIIFNGMKGIMQNIMFYIEDALTEQNVFKAIRKQSVYSLAKISGYEAYYGSAASGVLLGKLQLNNGLPSMTTKVFISNYTKVLNSNNGLIYTILLPTDHYIFDVSKPLITHQFKIVQGILTVHKYTALGTSLETIHISSLQLFDREYITVKVNGEIWNEVDNLYDMTENGHEYMIQIGYDNAFDIIFGNDVYGSLLTEGDDVEIEYIKHSGNSGNIQSDERCNFTFQTYGIDSLGNQVNINDYMTLSMSSCVSGGTDSDSIEFIRNMIGTSSRSRVLASEDNFRLFFKRFSFVGYISCWAEANSMIINAVCLSNIKSLINNVDEYFKIEESKFLINEEQKEMINNTLQNSNKSFAGITLKFNDPIIRKYAFICYIKVDNNYNKDVVIASIRNILGNYFLNIKDSIDFISKAELITLIMNSNEYIKSIDIDIISEAAEKAYYDNYYVKYEMQMSNGIYKYVPIKKMYDSSDLPGLDEFNNIKLDSKMEVPILHGGFKYYPNKKATDNSKYDSIMTNEIEVYFI